MLDNLTERYGRARDVYGHMPPGRKVLFLGAITAVVAGFIVLLLWTNQTDFGVLYSGLSQSDAGDIVAQLEERKIPYQVSANGTVISVPQEILQETRLHLATEGLPAGGAVGMELFNKTNLGATDFVQRLNYQRALQGELERTIKKFPEVSHVRVHLNIPKESLFIEEKRDPSASVVLNLKGSRQLSRAQLAGIVHLVASSVEGLKPENISVVDTAGGLLYSKEREDGGFLTDSQIQQRRAMERGLAERITSMLERVVGPGKAIARVTAEMNIQQVTTDEEIYDPDRTVVRSEQRASEKGSGPGRGVSGIPDGTFELGTGNRQQTGTGGQGEVYEKTEETTNYEVTRINRRTQVAAGEVKRLSVAVIVDGTYTETKKDGETVRTFLARPQSELAQLEKLVKNAVGFKDDRGDSVVVSSVPFHLPEEEAAKWWTTVPDSLRQFGKPALNVFLIVLFFLFVARPVIGWLARETEPIASVPEPAALPESKEGAGAYAELPRPEKGKLTRDHVLTLAQQNPDRTLGLIRSWIDQR